MLVASDTDYAAQPISYVNAGEAAVSDAGEVAVYDAGQASVLDVGEVAAPYAMEPASQALPDTAMELWEFGEGASQQADTPDGQLPNDKQAALALRDLEDFCKCRLQCLQTKHTLYVTYWL